MKKRFKLDNLDCANCAAKMERMIAALDGVQSVSVSFLTQKLTLEAEDDKFEALVDEAARIVKKIEPDCELIR